MGKFVKHVLYSARRYTMSMVQVPRMTAKTSKTSSTCSKRDSLKNRERAKQKARLTLNQKATFFFLVGWSLRVDNYQKRHRKRVEIFKAAAIEVIVVAGVEI